ncbi:MAG: ParB/RepB/Spo0J family partition protein [Balneola sp.]
MAKKVLGRGLGVYFPEYQSDEEKSTENAREPIAKQGNKEKESKEIDTAELVNVVLHIPVEDIRANPHQPRKEFDEEKLHELADSIKEHGIIQPLTVRYIGEKKFELISGERRLKASKLAGLKEVAAYVRKADDEQSMAFALIENIQREDLNALEVALAYKRLLEEFDYTQAQVAERVGKNRTTVTNMLRLLSLPDFIQTALKKNQIAMGHARSLITIEDASDQQQLLKKAVSGEWSVRQMEEAVRNLDSSTSTKKKVSANKDKSNPFYDNISSRLRQTFSTKVQINPKAKGGEIKIEYYSEDDLERILGILDSI